MWALEDKQEAYALQERVFIPLRTEAQTKTSETASSAN